jgi:uncharacterized membrane-anchored protein YjiN (DUF445 family)
VALRVVNPPSHSPDPSGGPQATPRFDAGSAASRARAFVVARRRATALLAVFAVVFVVVTVLGAHGTVLGYVQAGAEAAMIGGIADWFAVTALFRHPLGIPIPHTALIVERKDQFGATLGQFFQENFLNGDVLAQRLKSAQIPRRLASWMSNPDNASVSAGRAADLVTELVDLLHDEDVDSVLARELTRLAEQVDLATLLGRGLRAVMAGERHDELFDALVEAADKYLVEHHVELRERFAKETPNWIPDSLDRRFFDRIHTRVRRWLASVAANRDDEARHQFAQWITGLSDRLESSPEIRGQVEKLKRDLLNRAEIRDWSNSIWLHIKQTLRAQAADPESELRRQLASAVVSVGERLESDPGLQASLDRMIESSVRAFADQFHDELSNLVSSTVARWDAEMTANQLELLLGRDLQFIRINGSVVGAAIGLALHALAAALS